MSHHNLGSKSTLAGRWQEGGIILTYTEDSSNHTNLRFICQDTYNCIVRSVQFNQLHPIG